MPNELRELMRHSSIQTTLAYYVGENAEETAAKLRAGKSNSFGNNSSAGESAQQKTPANRGYNGQGRDRTADTRIFSPVLYQLSYLSVGLILKALLITVGFCCQLLYTRFYTRYAFGCRKWHRAAVTAGCLISPKPLSIR